MEDNFGYRVTAAKSEYKREKHNEPGYLIINRNTFISIKDEIRKRKTFGLIDKKIYKGLYIAIDNELDDYEFVIKG